ncbi:hypothetical protein FOA52_001139 [Chlamydomonas sp. UWO 241]|nr:hypothetical protein FOA52_001139 [Chlamydomonas sp. UWO 241]
MLECWTSSCHAHSTADGGAAAQQSQGSGLDSFQCRLCWQRAPLTALSDVCHVCLVCGPCAEAHVSAHLSREAASLLRNGATPTPPQVAQGWHGQQAAAVATAAAAAGAGSGQAQARACQPSFAKGDAVTYLDRERGPVPATVVDVDWSAQPPQYGVLLPGAAAPRYTERERLQPRQPGPSFAKGDAVSYLDRERGPVSATVVDIDRSVDPPQYGVLLTGQSDPRYTERERLQPRQPEPAFAKGDAVSYLDRERGPVSATVVDIDQSVDPPQYGVLLTGHSDPRYTECERLQPRQPEPAFAKGDAVSYLDRERGPVSATVVDIDRSVDPPQYGVLLTGHSDPRYTERERLKRRQPDPSYALGDEVVYLDRERGPVHAVVVDVDRSVHPPQYGVVFRQAGGAGVGAPMATPASTPRYTEPERLRPAGSWDCRPEPNVRSPCCDCRLSLAQLQAVSATAYRTWESACTQLWLDTNGAIRCPAPGCGAFILRERAATNAHTRGRSSSGGGGGGSSGGGGPAADAHKAAHRFRCALCSASFCDACRSVPYHGGLSCSDAARPECLYCGDKVLSSPPELGPSAQSDEFQPPLDFGAAPAGCSSSGSNMGGAQMSAGVGAGTHALRGMLRRLDVDATWCLEATDLRALALHVGTRMCDSPECRAKLSGACTRPLRCGHFCCGVRGEAECPPCIWCPPRQSHPGGVDSVDGAGGSRRGGGGGCATMGGVSRGGYDVDSDDAPACAICLEPVCRAPAVKLPCGASHLVHASCAAERLERGYPGPQVSFGYLFCSLCACEGGGARGNVQVATAPSHLDLPALQGPQLSAALALRVEVSRLARARLLQDADARSDSELQPGGSYDGRPADFALLRYAFYECAVCSQPYHGGARACAAAGAPVDRKELVCGGCAARANGGGDGTCVRHGSAFIEWKCRYCCSPASWFCWGTTHMCNGCHEAPARRTSPPACNGRDCSLPMALPHPPPGAEACLGRRVAVPVAARRPCIGAVCAPARPAMARRAVVARADKGKPEPEASQTKSDSVAAKSEGEETTLKYGLEAGLYKTLTGKEMEGMSKTDQAKGLLAQYGSAYLITSISLAIVSFSFCYLAVDSGVDVGALLTKVGINVSSTSENVGTFAIAYAAHKALSPIRFPPTVALTPIVAKWTGGKKAEEPPSQ